MTKLNHISDTKAKYAIYEILDEHFQGKPFPIYVKCSKLEHPTNKLLSEVLESSAY